MRTRARGAVRIPVRGVVHTRDQGVERIQGPAEARTPDQVAAPTLAPAEARTRDQVAAPTLAQEGLAIQDLAALGTTNGTAHLRTASRCEQRTAQNQRLEYARFARRTAAPHAGGASAAGAKR